MEVQANLGAYGVPVETTAEEKLYQSQGELTVLGTGFNTSRLAGVPGLPNSNTLSWSNGIRGKGTKDRREECPYGMPVKPGTKAALDSTPYIVPVRRDVRHDDFVPPAARPSGC